MLWHPQNRAHLLKAMFAAALATDKPKSPEEAHNRAWLLAMARRLKVYHLRATGGTQPASYQTQGEADAAASAAADLALEFCHSVGLRFAGFGDTRDELGAIERACDAA